MKKQTGLTKEYIRELAREGTALNILFRAVAGEKISEDEQNYFHDWREQQSTPEFFDKVYGFAHADVGENDEDELRAIISEALEPGVFGLQDRSRVSAPEDARVRLLGEQIGFGALMDSANRMWRLYAIEKGHDGSEFIVGPCRKVHESWVAKATFALKGR